MLGFFSFFDCVPHIRQRPEVALFGFVSTRCIVSEVLIKASFIKKTTMLPFPLSNLLITFFFLLPLNLALGDIQHGGLGPCHKEPPLVQQQQIGKFH
jgi:hypothetical protein